MDQKDFQIERLILKTGNQINSIRETDLAHYNLTTTQSESILYYSRHPGSSIKELAEYLQISHQGAQKLVEKLKTKGILETSVSPEDHRVIQVSLSEAGAQLCQDLKRNGSSTGDTILQGFTEDEKVQLLDYLQRVRKNL